MKKLLSVILVLAVVFSLCTTFFVDYQFYDVGNVVKSVVDISYY